MALALGVSVLDADVMIVDAHCSVTTVAFPSNPTTPSLSATPIAKPLFLIAFFPAILTKIIVF